LNYFINDHSVEAEYPEDGSCEPSRFTIPKVAGTFEIAQFHVHTGSEHSLEGYNAIFELHCVHKLKSGTGTQEETGITNTQAVLAMWFKVGDHNDAFQPLLDGWEAFQDGVLSSDACVSSSTRRELENSLTRRLAAFSVYKLVEKTTAFWHYDGSLTTPPCTEDVWWNMANEGVAISAAQWDTMRDLILDYRDENCTKATGADRVTNSTSRPLQDLNGRAVSFMCRSGSPSVATAITSLVASFLVGFLLI
jgi:carbonic anhydrase